MTAAALVLAALAAALHVFTWYLESFAWTTRARSVLGTTLDEAEATRETVLNQGFSAVRQGTLPRLALVALAVA